MTRIGLLLPNSNFINRLASDVRQWVEVGLKSAGLTDFELVIETTSYNESEKELRTKLQSLLVKENVDVVIAPLNPGMILKVEDLMKGQQVPLIVLSMGEDVVINDTSTPWVFHISFNLWRSAWLTGKQAVEKFGPKACSVMALHEGGYGLSFAFGLGVEAAGGTDGGGFPLPIDATPDQAIERFEWVGELQPDFVLLLGTGDDKEVMSAAYSKMETKYPTVELAPPGYLAGVKIPIKSPLPTTVISTWNPASIEGRKFIEQFAEGSDEPAHCFAVMAVEAGELLGDALKHRGDKKGGKALASALLEAKCTGPRGEISFDKETQETVLPQHHLQMNEHDDGSVSMRKDGEVELPDLLIEQIGLARQNIEKQGWLNPYLIA